MIDELKKAQAVNWIMMLREIIQTPDSGAARTKAVQFIEEVAALEDEDTKQS